MSSDLITTEALLTELARLRIVYPEGFEVPKIRHGKRGPYWYWRGKTYRRTGLLVLDIASAIRAA